MPRKTNDQKMIEKACEQLKQDNSLHVTPEKFIQLIKIASTPVKPEIEDWYKPTATIERLTPYSYYLSTGISKGGKNKGDAWLKVKNHKYYFPKKYLVLMKI